MNDTPTRMRDSPTQTVRVETDIRKTIGYGKDAKELKKFIKETR